MLDDDDDVDNLTPYLSLIPFILFFISLSFFL